jgi:hypothetical protein
MAGLQPLDRDRAHGHALEVHHLVAELSEHAADFPVLPLGEHDLQHRGVAPVADGPHPLGADFPLGQPDPLDELVEGFPFGIAGDEGAIDLLHAELRVGQPVRQLPVVREDHEPRAVLVESAHGVDTLGDLGEEVHHPGTAGGVVVGRDDPLRLVDREVNAALGLDPLAVELDLLTCRIDLGPHLADDLAVDADAALEDQLLAGTSRSHAGPGEELVQSLGSGRPRALGLRPRPRPGGSLRPGRLRPGCLRAGRPLGLACP